MGRQLNGASALGHQQWGISIGASALVGAAAMGQQQWGNSNGAAAKGLCVCG